MFELTEKQQRSELRRQKEEERKRKVSQPPASTVAASLALPSLMMTVHLQAVFFIMKLNMTIVHTDQN